MSFMNQDLEHKGEKIETKHQLIMFVDRKLGI